MWHNEKKAEYITCLGDATVIETCYALAENTDSIAQNVENVNHLVHTCVNMLFDVAEPLFGTDIKTGNKIDNTRVAMSLDGLMTNISTQGTHSLFTVTDIE